MNTASHVRLNGICPYFTMFPLDFPLGVLSHDREPNGPVIDPFCGRGTTNFAARLCGLPTVGIDISPVATAATDAKLARVTPVTITDATQDILKRHDPVDVPEGDFWNLAYRPEVLEDICRLRSALLGDSLEHHTAAALRGIVLGALHGPTGRVKQSYFSNQCPRTYGPKPAYAVRFWTERNLTPPPANVLEIVADRADRYYGQPLPNIDGSTVLGDSRCNATVDAACGAIGGHSWVITSPPYLGMRTYDADQWIRNWFLGGEPEVDYSASNQLSHASEADFANNLRQVWNNVGGNCRPGATMVVRFGAIGSRPVDEPARLIHMSLEGTNWITKDIRDAHAADRGKRQADTFNLTTTAPTNEVDVWAEWIPQ